MRSAILSVLILSGSLFANSAVVADTLSGHHARVAGHLASQRVAVRIPDEGLVATVAAYPIISKSEAASIAHHPNTFAVRGDVTFRAAARKF
jgi:hypothetical protein